DDGDSWTQPMAAPFAGARPFIGQLADGRLLATFRNQAGNRGTYAWLGHIQRDLGYRVSGLHRGPEELSVSPQDGLCIRHPQLATTQYNLLPPESYRSEVILEARVRVEGEPGETCAYLQVAHIGVRLSVRRDGLYLDERGRA